MFDRFERPLKILCLALAALLAWQLGRLILRGDPLANLKIPALPTLPASTNEPAKLAQKGTNAAPAKKAGSQGTNAIIGAHAATGTNAGKGTNMAAGTNAGQGTNLMAKSTNASIVAGAGQTNASATPTNGLAQKPAPSGGRPGLPPGMTPRMMAGMMGGPGAGGMKRIELPPEVQARVDRIIDSEILGPIIRPMPVALLGISEQVAYIRATTGQTGSVKVGAEMGGIKLLRVGLNRVLVEQDGEKKELTLFDGLGGESLMPKETNAPSTNMPSTNAPSTNAPARKAPTRLAAAHHASTNQILSSKQKETP